MDLSKLGQQFGKLAQQAELRLLRSDWARAISMKLLISGSRS
jgi:hypothetical protein